MQYTTISRKVVRKKFDVHATIPKANMGYDQYTVSDTVAVKITKVASLSNLKYKSMAPRAVLANFYEEQ